MTRLIRGVLGYCIGDVLLLDGLKGSFKVVDVSTDTLLERIEEPRVPYYSHINKKSKGDKKKQRAEWNRRMK